MCSLPVCTYCGRRLPEINNPFCQDRFACWTRRLLISRHLEHSYSCGSTTPIRRGDEYLDARSRLYSSRSVDAQKSAFERALGPVVDLCYAPTAMPVRCHCRLLPTCHQQFEFPGRFYPDSIPLLQEPPESQRCKAFFAAWLLLLQRKLTASASIYPPSPLLSQCVSHACVPALSIVSFVNLPFRRGSA